MAHNVNSRDFYEVLGLKKGVYIEPSGAVKTVLAPLPVDSLGRTLGGPGLPAIGASVVGGVEGGGGGGVGLSSSEAVEACMSAAAASGGSKVEALLGAMLTTLQSIDQQLRYARVTPLGGAAA